MTAATQLARSEDVALVLRTAACLGALGFSPHEVQCAVAAELNVDQHFVAQILRSGKSGSVCAVA